MADLLKIVLSLSLSGTLLILVFFLLKPLWKDKFSKQWQYYIWLIVIARLIIPFAPETNLVGTIFQWLETNTIQSHVIPKALNMLTESEQVLITGNNENGTNEKDTLATQNTLPAQNLLPLSLYIFFIWFVVVLILFVRKITIYQGFARYIKVGQTPVDNIDILNRFAIVLSEAGIKKNIELATNPLISSPLFMGFFRPCIVLPDAALSETDFCYTIQHELTHYKRQDMCYKWLVQLVICIHWFNPFVYLMGREINRACELSCDEVVIRHLNPQQKAAYGDTLLNAMETRGIYKDSLASITLHESKKLLKERLDTIMKFKTKTKTIICATLTLTLVICCGATYVGAYTSTYITPNKTPKNNSSGTTIEVQNSNISFQSVNIANNSDIVLENYDFFLIGGITPAIKPTFTNNTSFEITEIAADIDFLDKGGIVAYKMTTHTPVKSGESISNSSWGLATGIDKIRLCIRSYTTKEGKVYKIENDKTLWYNLEVNFSTGLNNIDDRQTNGYETIVIDNPNMDNALYFERGWLKGYYYYAYGPYYAGVRGEENDVLFNVENGVDGSMLIATAKNKECQNGINNTFSINSSYNGKITILTNDDGYYYVIIGAKEIKDLKGTIQVPIYE